MHKINLKHIFSLYADRVGMSDVKSHGKDMEEEGFVVLEVAVEMAERVARPLSPPLVHCDCA